VSCFWMSWPAAGDRPRQHRPRPGARHLSGSLSADRGDEPVPLRPLCRACLWAGAALRGRLPGPAVGTAARSHRLAHRRPGRGADGSRIAPCCRGQRRRRRPGRGGPRPASPALCGAARRARYPHQCRGGRGIARPGRQPRACRPRAARPRERAATTGYCASPAPWRTSKARRSSRAATSPRR
jgi:hypothetical protein